MVQQRQDLRGSLDSCDPPGGHQAGEAVPGNLVDVLIDQGDGPAPAHCTTPTAVEHNSEQSDLRFWLYFDK